MSEAITCVDLPLVIKALAMGATQTENTTKEWSELSVGDLLKWLEAENKKMVYTFRQKY